MTSSDTESLPTSPWGVVTEPDIRIEQYRSTLNIHGSDFDSLELSLVSPDISRKAVAQFAYAAEAGRPLGLPVDTEDAQDFLSYAKGQAYRCFVECIPESNRKLRALRDVFASSMASAAVRGTPLQVEIVNHGGEFLPWEWMGGRDRQLDYEAEARSVLGFAGVVYRRDPRREDQGMSSGFLTSTPLQLRFFRHPDLDGARVEKRFFTFSGVFRLLGPFPQQSGPLMLAEQLADPLYEAPDGPDQIVHLSCHHEAKRDPKELSAFDLALLESTISFGHSKEGEPREVSVRDLGYELADLEGAPLVVNRPLVFFNGCRGDFHPFATESVVDTLLRNGNRGVVSTSLKVPDDVAADFGRFFYQRLLTGEMSAFALWSARWDLLATRGSPLGLLYSYSGQPELRVAPVPQTPQEWTFPLIGSWSR